MGSCRKLPVIKLALFAILALLLWQVCRDYGTPREENKLLVALEAETRRCLLRRGLDSSGVLGSNVTYSTLFCPKGDGVYPRDLCTAHTIYLNHSERRFVARTTLEMASRVNKELSPFSWPLRTSSDLLPSCTRYYDEAFIFTVDMSSTPDDRYYRLHTVSFLPLFSLLMMRRHLGPVSPPGFRVALMPAVEDFSVKTVDWKSDVFSSSEKFGMIQQLVEVFAGGMETVPLVQSSLKEGTITCIRVAHFGVGAVNISDPSLLRGFSSFIQSRLGLPRPMPIPKEPVVCLVRRSANRRILNEEEVVSALSKFVKVQVVQLDALSYREQVSQMQQFTILIGFHGAELLNAIYMPVGSVTIQLVPYKARSLPVDTYAQLLRANGPYLEWQNKNERMTRPNMVQDRDNNLADTLLNTEEVADLVKLALHRGVNAQLVSLTERT